jgi:hypothetical protein
METEKSPAPRTHMNIDVEFRRSYAREPSHGNLRNVSVTGAFLTHSERDVHPGDKMVMTFTVSGRIRQVQALIVWNNSQGSGIKFLPMNNRDVQIVDDLIYFVESKKTGTRGILDQIFKKVA